MKIISQEFSLADLGSNIKTVFLKKIHLFYFVYECVACMFVCMAHAYLVPLKPEEGIRSPETGLLSGCELLCGC